ncbi:MAG TPA: site-2 protease family protein [Hyphomicrobium sp.]|jgi:Zn-dependent protease|uniref:M50 family metallopeptidase n=1 Tax=Hyphomicrobium sp. TaxID=82 RepID=UPI002CBFDB4C|nr:site-2 protease family protein [Hyphomicrobium sp.]HXE01643.1 site-2 protease family protein [Hyphomicrobium sp.]
MNFLDDTPRLELFRLAGIPVRVDITFALVPLFLFGILQQAPFAIAGPAFAAIIAGVFLSILLHEIGHATVARLLGVRVGEILVGGFYGYARMLDAPRSTAANVAILFAGPLANGLLFLGFWSLLGYPEISARGYFSQIEPSQWIADRVWLLRAALTLTLVNLAMLIFNLLPAFPLDGGRIYRDLIATVTSRASAAKIIAGLGVIVGLWSAFIGLRTDIVLMLIGAQIAIVNWAILKRPADAEQM